MDHRTELDPLLRNNTYREWKKVPVFQCCRVHCSCFSVPVFQSLQSVFKFQCSQHPSVQCAVSSDPVIPMSAVFQISSVAVFQVCTVPVFQSSSVPVFLPRCSVFQCSSLSPVFQLPLFQCSSVPQLSQCRSSVQPVLQCVSQCFSVPAFQSSRHPSVPVSSGPVFCSSCSAVPLFAPVSVCSNVPVFRTFQ